jgi:hypothetical protein
LVLTLPHGILYEINIKKADGARDDDKPGKKQ